MKFSNHLGKGAWAFASRALPLLYGITIVLVARAIPLEQFGMLAVFQQLFTILFSFSDGFALQAIVKFGVEPETGLEELVTVSSTLFLAILSVAFALILMFPTELSSLLNIKELASLLPTLVALAAVTMPRVIFSKVLQSRFRMREIFFVDLANFGVASLVLLYLLSQQRVHTANDVIEITLVSGMFSSAVAIALVRPFLKFRVRYSRKVLLQISEFVRYQAAMGLASTAQQNFDTIIVSSFTGAVGAAIYTGAKGLFRGFDILRETMTLFVFPATSKYYARGDISTLRNIIEKSVSFLYMLLIPASIVLAFGAPMIFHWLYGVKYDASVPIFRVLLVSGIVFPIQMVFGVTMTGMGKIKEAFRMFTISLVVNIAFSTVLLAAIGKSGAAIGFVIASCVQTVQLYLFVKKEVAFEPKQLLTRGWRDTAHFVRAKLGRR